MSITVELDTGSTISGVVIDDETNQPIPGVTVGAISSRTIAPFNSISLQSKTDSNGEFVLSGLSVSKLSIAAIHPDYAESWKVVAPGDVVEFRLRTGYAIFGRVFDNLGNSAEGISIEVFGEETPLPRTTLTNSRGEYRTPPIANGTVTVSAQSEPNFAGESVNVDLVDGDVEVNFGPRPEHISWHGTLYDFDATPAASAKLLLRSGLGTSLGRRPAPETFCDASGRFRFEKLLAGTYEISAYLRDRTFAQGFESVVLEAPGPVHRDLHLHRPHSESLPAEIRGIVVNSETGAPIAAKRASVLATSSDSPRNALTVPIDEEGRFHLRGLASGTYSLAVLGSSLPTKNVHGIDVSEGEIIDDLRILMAPWGSLHIALSGFEDPRFLNFRLDLEHEKGLEFFCGAHRIDSSGEWQWSKHYESGEWLVTLTFGEGATIERSVRIHENQESVLDLNENDVTPIFKGSITLTGDLVASSGDLVSNIQLSFYPHSVPSIGEEGEVRTARTDERGHFEAPGFAPGRWKVSAFLPSKGTVALPWLRIPQSSSDPYEVRLRIVDGKVTGSLYDKSTGRPFTEKDPTWWAFLRNPVSGANVSEIQGGSRGRDFTFEGVLGGRYELLVRAKGYHDYVGDVFSLVSGGQVDLGAIYMEPAGAMELEVVDLNGRSLADYRLSCDGRQIPPHARKRLGGGRFRVEKMPFRQVRIAIDATGYKPHEEIVEISRHRANRVRVVLQHNSP